VPVLATTLLALALLTLGSCQRKPPGHLPNGAPATEPDASYRATLPSIDPATAPEGDPEALFRERRAERAQMVSDQIRERGVLDTRVMDALLRVPRHRFVPETVRDDAYADRPLPIGAGQTISQPYIVAYMTEAAAPRPADRCLEIGTGSGYQAAVLAELCNRVHSIEYLPEVARVGERNLRALGYGADRVALRVGDGYRGWPEAAPFDVILVTAAPDHVPEPLLAQLAISGKMVIPVGERDGAQELSRWTRIATGNTPRSFKQERLLSVRFVPFLGDNTRH
jgi:protein-L-isoaspartate(D-aspartate) O-methyltransferase